ncbi:XVIPCD domain-containing protein [Stenotrophomonas maltophilia]|uniref:XVIPCD domain-containing protein n=1 Tax=Stenotrophomonas maltophilia TaxID=40324 RepID=UPI003CFDAB37
MPEMDINAAADEVVALLRQNDARGAAARLEALHNGQRAVVQESLDRYIAARGATELEALRRSGGVSATDAATVNPMLDRLSDATRPPRMPDAAETAGLSQAQQYDVYGSIVAQRGNAAANDAMATQDRVVLGLRDENRTTEARGRGVYDDRIVVLWKDAQGHGHVREFNQATTEPTAQYDGHAKTTPRSPGFGNVAPRTKTEGEDVNGDRVKDLGRLGEGTTEMRATTHPRNGHPDEFALRPSQAAITAGAGRVERDSNGDGWFDARDTQGVQHLNDTFKIHRGSRSNTDSAGCQTIGGGEYDDFVATVRGTPGQNRWQYVLTSVAPGQARGLGQDTPLAANDDPRQPQHRDHALQQQISTHLQALGGRYAEHADDYSLVMLREAKAAGITRVDQIVASNPSGGRAAGETLFLVQGNPGDPAAVRAGVNAAEVRETAVETSLRQLQQQAREQGAPVPAPAQQHEAPAMGGR